MVIKTIKKLIKKPVFLKGKADWLSELPFVIKKCYKTINHNIKNTPVQASKKANENEVYSNLRFDREKQTTKFKIGQLVRTADIQRVFSKVIQQIFLIDYTQ